MPTEDLRELAQSPCLMRCFDWDDWKRRVYIITSRWISEPPAGMSIGKYYAKSLRGFIRAAPQRNDEFIAKLEASNTADEIVDVLRIIENDILMRVAKCGGEPCAGTCGAPAPVPALPQPGEGVPPTLEVPPPGQPTGKVPLRAKRLKADWVAQAEERRKKGLTPEQQAPIIPQPKPVKTPEGYFPAGPWRTKEEYEAYMKAQEKPTREAPPIYQPIEVPGGWRPGDHKTTAELLRESEVRGRYLVIEYPPGEKFSIRQKLEQMYHEELKGINDYIQLAEALRIMVAEYADVPPEFVKTLPGTIDLLQYIIAEERSHAETLDAAMKILGNTPWEELQKYRRTKP